MNVYENNVVLNLIQHYYQVYIDTINAINNNKY
jgi:hypothetical protein